MAGRARTTVGACVPVLAAAAVALAASCAEPTASEPALCPELTELAVGETLELTAARRACLELPPIGGARYVLGVLDAREIQHEREGRFRRTGRFAYTVEALAPTTGTAPAGRTSARALVARPRPGRRAGPDRRRGGTAAATATVPTPATPRARAAPAAAPPLDCEDRLLHSALCRDRPWTLGERFLLDPPDGPDLDTPTDTARVAAIHGRLVFIVYEPHEAAVRESGILESIEAVRPLVRDIALPLLRTALADGHPTTAPGTGQLAVVLGRVGSFQLEAIAEAPDGGAALQTYIALDARFLTDPGHVYKTLVHELTHAWQALYAFESGGLEDRGWGIEGGADLLANESIRSHLGIALDANWDWRRESLRGPFHRRLAEEITETNGAVFAGRETVSSFLRHLLIQLVADRGVPYDRALRELARGAIENWFGSGAGRPGLQARMRALTGEPWVPEDALLDWMLNQALDDRAAAGGWANRGFLDAFDGWLPALTLSAGEAGRHALEGHPGADYLEIEDDGSGAAFRIESELPTLVWVLARWR